MKKIPLLPERDLVLWHAYNPKYRAHYEKIKDIVLPRKLWASQEDMPPFRIPKKRAAYIAWQETMQEALRRFREAWPAVGYPFPPDVARRDPGFFVDHLAPAVVAINNPFRDRNWAKTPKRGIDGRHPRASSMYQVPIFDIDLIGGRFLRLQVDLTKPWEEVSEEIQFAIVAARRAFMPRERVWDAPRRLWNVLAKAEELGSKNPREIAAALDPELFSTTSRYTDSVGRNKLREEVRKCLAWAAEYGLT